MEHECKTLQKEHEMFLKEQAEQGQEMGLKALLANRKEIKWEKVKEEPTSPIFLKKCWIWHLNNCIMLPKYLSKKGYILTAKAHNF